MNKKQIWKPENSITLGESGESCTAMCKYKEYLEIFTKSSTFRIIPSEDKTMEEIPSTASKIRSIGSRNAIIARVLIQSDKMINSILFENASIEKQRIIDHFHEIMDRLLICDAIAEKINFRMCEIDTLIRDTGINEDGGGKFLNPFPQVENLEQECSYYLIESNRIVKGICDIPFQFRVTKKRNADPSKIANALDQDKCEYVIRILNAFEPISRKINSLRNHQEHTEEFETVIRNIFPKSREIMSAPTWKISGKLDEYPETPILSDMQLFNRHMFHATEAIFIQCLLLAAAPNLPYYVESIPDNEIDPNCPMRYQASIDLSQLSERQPNSAHPL